MTVRRSSQVDLLEQPGHEELQKDIEQFVKIFIKHIYLLYLLAAIICSLIPRDIQYLFEKALKPNDKSRGRNLLTILNEFCKWWQRYFTVTTKFRGLCTREFDDFGVDGVRKEHLISSENIESIEAFRKCFKDREGSCDISAQLFVSALRSLGVPARLVSSLQPKSSSRSENKSHNNKNNNNNKIGNIDNSNDNDIMRVLGIGTYKLSLQNKHIEEKEDDHNQDEYNNVNNTKRKRSTTVYFEVHKKWFCVDPIRFTVNEPRSMEPATNDHNNVLAYVVAFDESEYIKDVTRRYTTKWGAKTRKLRVPPTKDGYDWWSETLSCFTCPFETVKISEKFPSSISEFNNHPLYALERHLKKYEILFPKEPVIGHIRGESIYPRKNIKQLHTTETWLREGRQIKEGEQPLKHVKSRIYTMSKRQAILFDEKVPEVGLYGEWQTEEYAPKPIVNGIVPKNPYGNLDMFKPSMCPPGGIHIEVNGIAKIAKKLGIDYAEAVVGFDFHSHRCVPVVNGIVIAEEYSTMLLEAWHEHITNVEALSNAKKDKEALARWKRLIVGIKIKMRIHSDYFSRGGDETDVELEEEAAYKKSEQYQSMDIDDDVDVTIERKIFEYIFTVASNLMTDNTNEIGNTAIFGFGQLIRI
ncbi:12804_t:CDS:10 [Entrophospora sp. SA101]|nr:12804_t:CDS:10 [Entrophospora sp. SA101]